jgi:hypothetical protein
MYYKAQFEVIHLLLEPIKYGAYFARLPSPFKLPVPGKIKVCRFDGKFP